jgi:hypothetical protein
VRVLSTKDCARKHDFIWLTTAIISVYGEDGMIKNPAAVTLGKLAKGKPKRYSKEEIKKRTERLKRARAMRKQKI